MEDDRSMEDDTIESFFKQMKAADEHLVIPPFRKERRTRVLPVFLYGIAATVALIVMVIFMKRPAEQKSVTNDEIVITIGNDALKTRSLVTSDEEETLYEWESPTEFLSEDF